MGRVREWPGPYVQRRDYDSQRPAVWLNCAYCGALFVRAADAAVRRREHHEGERSFCSIKCGRYFLAPPVTRQCVICGADFQAHSDHGNYGATITCETCTAAVLPEAQPYRAGLVVYAYEHGIMADYSQLQCESCGAAQAYRGKSRVKYIAITGAGGKYTAQCRPCRSKVAAHG